MARRYRLVAVAHVNDGYVVGIEPLPSLDVIEELYARHISPKQGGIDLILLQQARQEFGLLAFRGLEEVHDETLAVKFGAAVYEEPEAKAG